MSDRHRGGNLGECREIVWQTDFFQGRSQFRMGDRIAYPQGRQAKGFGKGPHHHPIGMPE